MKKAAIGLGAILLSAILGYGEEKTFSFLVSGGMTRITPDDLNSFLQDYARYRWSFGGLTGATDQNAEAKTLQKSGDLEFTLLVRAAPRIFLTFGTGFISAGLESEPLVQRYTDVEYSEAREDMIQAIPVRIGILYSWPLSRRLSLRPHVSLDIYFSSFKETATEDRKDLSNASFSTWDKWEYKTNALCWGSTMGLTFDIVLSGPLSLFLDGGYRRARLSGFKGTEVNSASGESPSERDFRPFYYEFYAGWMETGYKFLNLAFSFGSTSLDVVRDAVLDLSGPYLKAGLRVPF
jgi:hypothetical protein